MTLSPNGPAPYTSSNAATTVLEINRDRGLSGPITADTLVRAGVSESIARRTMQSLVVLGLVGEDGSVSETLRAFNQARGDTEYKELLEAWLRDVYSDVLNYADPEKDDLKRLTDAFRGYEPAGQRSAMAGLLVGLWRHAGLPTAEPEKQSSPRKRKPSTAKTSKAQDPQGASGGHGEAKSTSASTRAPQSVAADLPPGLLGLLQQIPRGGASWSSDQRAGFLAAFHAVLDFTIPVADVDESSASAPEALVHEGADP